MNVSAKMVAAGALALGLAIATSASFAAKPESAKAESSGKLSQRAEQLLTEAEQAGKSSVVLLIAVRPGATTQAVSGISRLGGRIDYRDDGLGYIRASVPVGQVKAVAALGSVQLVEVDEPVPLPDPRPEGIAPLVPQVPPSAATPRNNPYLPIGETGAAQFTAAHPTWDGRGVTIGVVDLGITLDHPSLVTHLHR